MGTNPINHSHESHLESIWMHSFLICSIFHTLIICRHGSKNSPLNAQSHCVIVLPQTNGAQWLNAYSLIKALNANVVTYVCSWLKTGWCTRSYSSCLETGTWLSFCSSSKVIRSTTDALCRSLELRSFETCSALFIFWQPAVNVCALKSKDHRSFCCRSYLNRESCSTDIVCWLTASTKPQNTWALSSS